MEEASSESGGARQANRTSGKVLRKWEAVVGQAESPPKRRVDWDALLREPSSSEHVLALWHDHLSGIPALFGRLVHLSSMLDATDGLYRHWGLGLRFGAEGADRILRETHRQLFSTWLRLSLVEQKEDIDLYLSAVGGLRRHVIARWLETKPYRAVIPPDATPLDRELYLADHELLAAVLNNTIKHGDASRAAECMPEPAIPSTGEQSC